MKLLKKLLAAALVGVMALTMLTGCAQSVNEKQLVDALNDLHFLSYCDVDTIVQGDSKLAKQVLNNIKNHTATHPNDLDSIYSYFYDYAEFDHDYVSIVPKDTQDAYYYTFLRLDEFQSKEFSKNKTAYIAQLLYQRDNVYPLNYNDSYLYEHETTATASIATDKIGGQEYLVIIFVQKSTGKQSASPW